MSLLGPRTSICVRRVGSSFPPRQGNYRYAVIGSHNGGLAIFLYVLSLIAAAQIKEGKFESLVGAFRFCGGDHGESRSCRLESAKALLKENPDLVSYKDNYGGTALHRASEYGLKDLAEFLLANQADVNAKTKGGHTPLHYTAGYGQRDLGAGRNRADFAELLLSNHADVNARDNAGATPLHYAADRLKAIAELLLASNANIDAKDSNGMTPLHVAAGFGRRAGKSRWKFYFSKEHGSFRTAWTCCGRQPSNFLPCEKRYWITSSASASSVGGRKQTARVRAGTIGPTQKSGLSAIGIGAFLARLRPS
jgi:ankyrin repeat protein